MGTLYTTQTLQALNLSRLKPVLPVAFEALQQGRSLPLAPANIHVDGRTPLLVDDEPNVLSSLQCLFRREGYRILTADNGHRRLELCWQFTRSKSSCRTSGCHK